MPFENLLEPEREVVRPPRLKTKSAKIQKKALGGGCSVCPLNKVPGVKKIFGTVVGKPIFIWAQSPGPQENKEARELVGKAGQWWWKECEAAGITRDMCDIQNVVRCYPANYHPDQYPPLAMRDPTKEEIHCCSIYNTEALVKAKARVHLVLGQIAGKALLGKEFTKTKRIFWSEILQAKAVCLYHPSYFTRGGEFYAPDKLKQFRKDLRFAAQLANAGSGKYGYIEGRKYIGITTMAEARAAYEQIVQWSRSGERISCDIETGKVTRDGIAATDNVGKVVPLVYGFSGKLGYSYVFILSHPNDECAKSERVGIREYVRRILGDPEIKKVFQRGCFDVEETQKLLNIKVLGYDYDSELAEFFVYPGRRSMYSLAATVEARFPQFVGYKEYIAPDVFTDQFKAWLIDKKKTKLSLGDQLKVAKDFPDSLNFALIPWKKMVVYNGADCDIQKRIEATTKEKVSLPLMGVYIDAQAILKKMEQEDSPLFDYQHYASLENLFPVRRDWLFKRLVKLAGYKDFNPNSPIQVAKILYDKLKLPQLGNNPNTRKETLEALAKYHEFPNLLKDYRLDEKVCSTYLAGFKRSADANAGHVRTIWKLTGTATGRLSSGGGAEGNEGVVNLQNIHGNPHLQNLLVSDERWRDIYKTWRDSGDYTEKTLQPFLDYNVFLGFDHSQMELRCVAHKSGDPELLAAFKRGDDIHAEVGHDLTGWSVEKIKNDEKTRRLIKNMQFGIVYGLTAETLVGYVRMKGVTPEEASDEKIKDFYRRYFDKYKKVAEMIEADRKFVEKYGYTETFFGFRRQLSASNHGDGPSWENQAVNSPIQGSAHQLMLMGLVPIRRLPQKYDLLQHPQLEIHDAIYFVVQLGSLLDGMVQGKQLLEKECLNIVRDEFHIDWKVPLKADPKAGFRFGIQVKAPKTLHGFVNDWCKKNRELQNQLVKEKKELDYKLHGVH